MEKIIIHPEHEYIHLNLGISDERADAMENEIKEQILNKAVENGIVIINDVEETVELSAARVMDFLINRIAKTTQEQLFLMMHVDNLTKVLDRHIKAFSGGSLSSDN